MNCPDNYDAFVLHDTEQARGLARYPVCEYCEDHITDEKAFYIEGVWYHKSCMEACFEREVIPE